MSEQKTAEEFEQERKMEEFRNWLENRIGVEKGMRESDRVEAEKIFDKVVERLGNEVCGCEGIEELFNEMISKIMEEMEVQFRVEVVELLMEVWDELHKEDSKEGTQ